MGPDGQGQMKGGPGQMGMASNMGPNMPQGPISNPNVPPHLQQQQQKNRMGQNMPQGPHMEFDPRENIPPHMRGLPPPGMGQQGHMPPPGQMYMGMHQGVQIAGQGMVPAINPNEIRNNLQGPEQQLKGENSERNETSAREDDGNNQQQKLQQEDMGCSLESESDSNNDDDSDGNSLDGNDKNTDPQENQAKKEGNFFIFIKNNRFGS